MRYNNRCGRIRAGQPVVKASSNFMGAALERLIWFQRKLTTANGKKGGSFEERLVDRRKAAIFEMRGLLKICFVRGVCVGCATVLSSEKLTRDFHFSSSLFRSKNDWYFVRFRQNLDLSFFYFVKRKEEEKKKRRRRDEEKKNKTKYKRNFYNFNVIDNDWRFCIKYSMDFYSFNFDIVVSWQMILIGFSRNIYPYYFVTFFYFGEEISDRFEKILFILTFDFIRGMLVLPAFRGITLHSLL